MGKTYNIYLGDEAVLKLEEKRKDKAFNLSAFVSLMLQKSNENAHDIPQLELQVKQKRTAIQQIETEIDAILYEIKKIIDESKSEQIKIQEEAEKLKRNHAIQDYWHQLDEIGKQEYRDGVKLGKWKSTAEFFDIQHKKEV